MRAPAAVAAAAAAALEAAKGPRVKVKVFVWAFSADGASVQILTHVVWCTWMCYLINK